MHFLRQRPLVAAHHLIVSYCVAMYYVHQNTGIEATNVHLTAFVGYT